MARAVIAAQPFNGAALRRARSGLEFDASKDGAEILQRGRAPESAEWKAKAALEGISKSLQRGRAPESAECRRSRRVWGMGTGPFNGAALRRARSGEFQPTKA